MEPEQKRRWVNLNAFIARLSQAADIQYTSSNEPPKIHPMDKSLEAIWVMSIMFEEKRPLKILINTAVMQAVCVWLIYAADRLWAHVQNGYTFSEDCNPGPGTKYKRRGWKGLYRRRVWKGFARERWDVWERGLQEAKTICTDEEMKKLIEDALTCMKRAMTDQ